MKSFVVLFLFLACNYRVYGKEAIKTFDSIGQRDQERIIEINKQFDDYRKSFKTVTNLLPLEAQKIKNPLFIDAREAREQRVSIIPGAITLEEFDNKKESFKSRSIIVYCTIGYRSGLYAKQLISRGFNAYNLKGGVLLWSHSKQKFIKEGKFTQKVHVYSKQWDLLDSSYIPVY